MSMTPSAPNSLPPRTAAEQSKFAWLLAYLIRGRRKPGEVVVVSHSDLFYWWPVWLLGFIMSLITLAHGVQTGFVRGHPKVVVIDGEISYKDVDATQRVEKLEYPRKNVKAIITDNTSDPFPLSQHGDELMHIWPLTHNSKSLGMIFCIALLLVIVITNVHLRGLWSVIALVIIILGSIILALMHWWEKIFAHGQLLDLHINMGTYLAFSTVLFVVWLINFIFFDRQRYVAVTPGQVRLHLAIGEGEKVYDTLGMVFEKQRSDLFRHWILGFGSGDLMIRPGQGKDPIDLPNVLFVGSKVNEIQELLKEREVVASMPGR